MTPLRDDAARHYVVLYDYHGEVLHRTYAKVEDMFDAVDRASPMARAVYTHQARLRASRLISKQAALASQHDSRVQVPDQELGDERD